MKLQPTTNEHQSPRIAPQSFSQWEDPELSKLTELKLRFLSRSPRPIFTTFIFSLALLLLTNLSSLRSLLIAHSSYYTTLIGNTLSFILFIRGIVQYNRYVAPLPTVRLSEKQIELFAWPKDYPNIEIVDDESVRLNPAFSSSSSSKDSTPSTPSSVPQQPHSYFLPISPSPATPAAPAAAVAAVAAVSTPPVSSSTPSTPASNPRLSTFVQRRLAGHSPHRFMAMTEPDLSSDRAFEKYMESSTKEEARQFLQSQQLQQHQLQQQQQHQHHHQDLFSTSVISSPQQFGSPSSAYKPAYRKSTVPSPSSATKVTGEFESSNTQSADELLAQLKIEAIIDEWAYRMRRWIARNIVAEVASLIDSVNKVGLERMPQSRRPDSNFSSTSSISSPGGIALDIYGLPFNPPSTPSAPLSPKLPTSPSITSSGTHGTSAPPTVNNEGMTYPGLHYLLDLYSHGHIQAPELTILDLYLSGVLESRSREYLVHRIKELAEGYYLQRFVWNGGGKWKGKDCAQDLPTDAQILIHLFCTFLDLKLPTTSGTTSSRPFSSRHFVLFPDTVEKRSGLGSVVISQTHIRPPHFEVVCMPSRTVWPVVQGRSNFFYSLVLFLYHVRKHNGGYIGQLSISQRDVNLASVLEPWIDDDEKIEE